MELSVPAGAAENFRLLLPLKGETANWILGSDQTVTSLVKREDGATLTWQGPLKDVKRREHNIDVVMEIQLLSEGMTFELAVVNHSSFRIAEVFYPVVGDILGLDPSQNAKIVGNPAPLSNRPFVRPFGEHVVSYPGVNMAFVDLGLQGKGCGLYLGAHDEVARYKLFRFFEQKRDETTDVFATVAYHPFIEPEGAFQGGPVVFRFHEGDWVEGGKRFYRPWFLETFGLKDREEDWIRHLGFYQMIMVMLPEGNINYRFEEIPQLARDGLKYGVDALQIAGWQRGGHDNGYPYYEPDPRLGTWEELEEAIVKCHRMGVKVYFFVNITVVNLDTEWYKRELHRCDWESTHGANYWIAGWGMGTLASRRAYTVPLMAFSDTSFPAMHDGHLGYFQKLASIGADGIHIDKMYPGHLNFNPNAPLSPDQSLLEGDLRLIRDIYDSCRAIRPDFCISFETNWDRVLSYGLATWWAGNLNAAEKIFPELIQTVGLYEPYDFKGVNHAVLNRWTVMVSPHHFNRSMGCRTWKGLSRYIGDLNETRRMLKETVLFGEEAGPGKGFELSKDLSSGPCDLLTRTYRDPRTGHSTTIVSNEGMEPAILKMGELEDCRIGKPGDHPESGEGRTAEGVLYRPGRRQTKILPEDEVEIPGERLVFLGGVSSGECRTKPRQWEGRAPILIVDFERDWPEGWTYDANWRLDDNSAGGWYQGWQGERFAWSGQGGEPEVGTLRSPTFSLQRQSVEVWTAGWADLYGRTSDRWNYVCLKLEDGTELDRAYAPNTTTFTPLLLNGKAHEGEEVYVEVVDDGTEKVYSMICVDQISQRDFPPLEAPLPVRDGKGPFLENALYRVEVSKKYGVLERIKDKQGGMELLREKRLAGNYTFTLPLPGKAAWQAWEANLIRGEDQPLDQVQQTDKELILLWQGPLRSVWDVDYDVDVEMRIALVNEQVEFRLHIDNRTPYEIGEVFFPVLGGMKGWCGEAPEKRVDPKKTELQLPVGTGVQVSKIFHTFGNHCVLGVMAPEQHYGYPDQLSMSWADLFQPSLGRGVYFGVHDPDFRYKVFHLEMRPGTSAARTQGNWPTEEELEGLPAGVRLSCVHMPYHPAGQSFEPSPVVLRAHEGDWQTGAAVYGAWSQETFSEAEGGDALRCVSWDARRLTQTGVVDRLLQEAAAQGRDTIVLKNWKRVPEGEGESWFEIEPALLSTLKEMLQKAHESDLKVLFHIDLEPANLGERMDPEMKKTLSAFVGEDRWGVPHSALGWGHGHSHSEHLATAERRLLLNPGDPEFRTHLVRQALDLAKLGGDGLSVGRFFGRPLDFQEGSDLTADRLSWQGGLQTLEAILSACRAENPTFLLLTTDVFDRLLPLTPHCGDPAPGRSPFQKAFPTWSPCVVP